MFTFNKVDDRICNPSICLQSVENPVITTTKEAKLEPVQPETSQKEIIEIGQLEKNQVHPKLKNLGYATLHTILNKATTLEIFTDFKIIPGRTSPPNCLKCGGPMKTKETIKSCKYKVPRCGFIWRCLHYDNKTNPCYGSMYPVRGTFLDKAKYPYEDIMFVIIGFAWNETSQFVQTHLNLFKTSRGFLNTHSHHAVNDYFQKLNDIVQIFASYGVTIIKQHTKDLDVQLHIFLQSVAAVYPGYGKTGLKRLTVDMPVHQTEMTKEVHDIVEKCDTVKSGNSRKSSNSHSAEKKIIKVKSLSENEKDEGFTNEESDSGKSNSTVEKHKDEDVWKSEDSDSESDVEKRKSSRTKNRAAKMKEERWTSEESH